MRHARAMTLTGSGSMSANAALMERPQFTSNKERWRALAERDPRADGAFYYSVRTTGVYCRPSCAARAPRPENVEFHESCAAAERAGFRPCRRCHPHEPGRDAQRVARACRMIDDAEEIPRLAELAAGAGLSVFHFHRLFKKVTGLTPRSYFAAQRARRVREALPHTASVTEAIYGAGFGSSSRFYQNSTAILGMSPGRFRAGGRDALIRYAVAECSLGLMLVASTDEGICAIIFGEDRGALVREIGKRFPSAQLAQAGKPFARVLAKVVRFVEQPASGLDLPLDVRGTAFQQRVWEALRKIPAGTKATYRELAQSIGAPKAVRAVAGACAANHIAVAIPCHRIVRGDGALGGYRWGINRKRALLAREARETLGAQSAPRRRPGGRPVPDRAGSGRSAPPRS